MSVRRGWFPREGFTADVVQRLVQATVLNPVLTVPLFLLAKYTDRGQATVLDHSLAFGRFKVFFYLSLFRWFNGLLNAGALGNWQGDKYDWSKEHVVITGGSDGIGKLVVQLFAAKGIRVTIIDRQKPTFELPNDKINWVSCDLTSPSDISNACETIRSEYSHPTVLIHNAGISNHHNILNTPDHLLQRVFAVNTLAHYRLTKEFLPHMIATNHGTIVTVASLAGYITVPGLVDYCGTKAAAVAYHEGLTGELVHRYNAPKIRTICVCPNFVDTKLSAGFRNDSRFLSPTLQPETIAEALFDKVISGTSGFVVVPKTHEWLACSIRSFPYWLQKGFRDQLKNTMRGVEKEYEEKDRLNGGGGNTETLEVGKEEA